jgi:hypothetical protein
LEPDAVGCSETIIRAMEPLFVSGTFIDAVVQWNLPGVYPQGA